MIEQDTVKLLRECDAGIKMGISSISDVLDHVENRELYGLLSECKDAHEERQCQIQKLLGDYHDDGKSPNPIAKGMSWMKTNMKLGMDAEDSTIADLMTDGCNMGVKALHRYLNQYKAADEQSKSLAKEVIGLEDELAKDIRKFL